MPMAASDTPSPAPRTPSPAPRTPDAALHVVRFGQQEPLEIAAGQVITFPCGLVGMENLRQFAIIDDPRTTPCRWLQSLEEPALAFVVVDPHLIKADYIADISGEDALQLELHDPHDADLWTIVTVQPDPARSTVNLAAPVVVNRKSRMGKQIILDDGSYALRHALMPDADTAPASAR